MHTQDNAFPQPLSMTSSQISNLDSIINDIDTGLLSIYHARGKGFTRVDFIKYFEKLFYYSRGINDHYKNVITTFASVINDLYLPVGYMVYTLIKINETERTLVYEEKDTHTKEVSERVHQLDERNFNAHLKEGKIGDRLAPIPVLKRARYLTGVKWNNGSEKDTGVVVGEFMFLERFKQIFYNNGYSVPTNQGLVTFEQYISWIDESHNKNKDTDILEKKFSHAAVALIYVYLKIAESNPGITKTNQDAIATKFGFNSPSSGVKIRQKYELLLDEDDRLLKKMARKDFVEIRINDITQALAHIPDQYNKAIERAKEELKNITNRFGFENLANKM